MITARTLMRLTIGCIWLPIVIFGGTVGCERLPTTEPKSSSSVLVRVNGEALTKQEFDLFLPEDYQHILTSEESKEYLERWINTELFYDAAVKSGVGATPEVKAHLEQYKKDFIADLFIQKVIQERALVSEDEVREYYDQHKDLYTKEYRVSHILVNNPEDIEKIKDSLKKYSFSYVARKYSIDKNSGPGGDLGYLSKGNMLPEFEDVVFKMDVGSVSDVIESDFGYHILRLVDVRDARFKLDYEDVKDEITNIIMLKKREAVYDSLLVALRARANIEYSEEPGGVAPEFEAGDSLPAVPVGEVDD
jgi:peptidyl-prolyl cis-trans isomerase C